MGERNLRSWHRSPCVLHSILPDSQGGRDSTVDPVNVKIIENLTILNHKHLIQPELDPPKTFFIDTLGFPHRISFFETYALNKPLLHIYNPELSLFDPL